VGKSTGNVPGTAPEPDRKDSAGTDQGQEAETESPMKSIVAVILVVLLLALLGRLAKEPPDMP